MSIQSGIGNITAGVGNAVDGGLAWASSRLESLVGTVKAGLGNIWGGGFAGISKDKIDADLIPALERYCETIEDSINQFNADADVTSSFAGPELAPAVKDFVSAIKELLKAYVSTMRKEIASVNSAYEQYTTGSQSVASNVSTNAQDIRSAASEVRLD